MSRDIPYNDHFGGKKEDIVKTKGSPIKGQVKKKNTSPDKKGLPFLLGHDARISTASF